MFSFTRSLTLALAATIFIGTNSASFAAIGNTQQPTTSADQIDARAQSLINQMTLAEKVKLLSGTDDEMHIPGIERLGIPSLKFTDGPVGVRCWGRSTAYPAGALLAATWDVDAAQAMGKSLGRDCRARGVHVLLGPGVDLYRVAQCGRNFEYLGEDPFLSAKLATAWVKGVQGEGVATSVKHYAANDQETLRDSVDTIVDERRLHEICLPPFKATIEDANAATLMAAYNKVNGSWCTANKYLLEEVLRKQWGFKGILMSDWGAVHELPGPITAGTDLEMGKTKHYTLPAIEKMLQDGALTMAQIDDHVRRVLRTEIEMGFLDREQTDKSIPENDPTSAATALRVAREGVTLLKNDKNVLPLNKQTTRKVVVIGPNAAKAVTGGGGSSQTEPFASVCLLDAVRNVGGPRVSVFFIPATTKFAPDEIAMIKSADAVVAGVGFNPSLECEGFDRPYDLPADQVTLLQRVSQLNPRTVAVLNAGGNVGMDKWIDKTAALLHAWYPGQNGNTAVAEAIFGDINPSGHLPDTFEKQWKDSPAYGNYPGDQKNGGTVKYSEGIYVGYRWFDKKKIAPRFPFGYGLSYTTFALNGLKVARDGQQVRATVNVRNTGKRSGATVVQLYVRPVNSTIDRPMQELKAFSRVELKPGETKPVTLTLGPDAFATYDVDKHAWVTPTGDYQIAIGTSSRDIAATQPLAWK